MSNSCTKSPTLTHLTNNARFWFDFNIKWHKHQCSPYASFKSLWKVFARAVQRIKSCSIHDSFPTFVCFKRKFSKKNLAKLKRWKLRKALWFAKILPALNELCSHWHNILPTNYFRFPLKVQNKTSQYANSTVIKKILILFYNLVSNYLNL